MTEEFNYTLDITHDLCPMTFVRAKLLVEKMLSGQIAEIRLQGIEPLTNVPRSLAELGHEITSIQREDGEPEHGIHRLIIRKK